MKIRKLMVWGEGEGLLEVYQWDTVEMGGVSGGGGWGGGEERVMGGGWWRMGDGERWRTYRRRLGQGR